MGFDILLDEDAITPHRMYAMVCLLRWLPNPKRQDLLGQLQPSSLIDNTDAAARVYRALKQCDLIYDDSQNQVRFRPPESVLLSLDNFRTHMQSILLGATEENQAHYVLNQFAAWYAVQGESVFGYSRPEIELKFNEQLYPSAQTRVFRERSDYNTWRTWAEFLGWGWPLAFSARRDTLFVPDATIRIRPLLPSLLTEPNKVDIPMSAFMGSLRALCPELDGGVLFEQCWEASRGNEVRGNRLSLMLTTALRVLHRNGEIELVYRPDATDVWTLFPAQSYIPQVTHIRRMAVTP